MIKLEYIGEDDITACLRCGDIFLAEPSEDGLGYFIKNKLGEESYVANHEVSIY